MSKALITDAELDRMFRPLAIHAQWGLAVSGGRDSMALMHLAARWLAREGSGAKTTVLTVDHGLRREAGEEAAFAARAAAKFGLVHRTLRWEGVKPESGIQAAAREARYDLMADFATANEIDCLVTAHHLNDQAETMLMRLKRGSGPDGLAGIPEVGRWAGLPVFRPLLGIASARLEAVLTEAGLAWIEDPSNEDERYERVRVRKAMAELRRLGYTAEAFASTARRMRRAREALEAATVSFLAANATLWETGYCAIGHRALADAPEEIALRAVERAIEAVRGGEADIRLARLETLTEELRRADCNAWTLGGCRIVPGDGKLLVLREAGRKGLAEFGLQPGETRLWDRRFRVVLPPAADAPVTVRALGQEGARQLRARAGKATALPAAAAVSLVSFWRGEDLLAVPPLDYRAPEAAATDSGCAAQFINAKLFGDPPR